MSVVRESPPSDRGSGFPIRKLQQIVFLLWEYFYGHAINSNNSKRDSGESSSTSVADAHAQVINITLERLAWRQRQTARFRLIARPVVLVIVQDNAASFPFDPGGIDNYGQLFILLTLKLKFLWDCDYKGFCCMMADFQSSLPIIYVKGNAVVKHQFAVIRLFIEIRNGSIAVDFPFDPGGSNSASFLMLAAERRLACTNLLISNSVLYREFIEAVIIDYVYAASAHLLVDSRRRTEAGVQELSCCQPSDVLMRNSYMNFSMKHVYMRNSYTNFSMNFELFANIEKCFKTKLSSLLKNEENGSTLLIEKSKIKMLEIKKSRVEKIVINGLVIAEFVTKHETDSVMCDILKKNSKNVTKLIIQQLRSFLLKHFKLYETESKLTHIHARPSYGHELPNLTLLLILNIGKVKKKKVIPAYSNDGQKSYKQSTIPLICASLRSNKIISDVICNKPNTVSFFPSLFTQPVNIVTPVRCTDRYAPIQTRSFACLNFLNYILSSMTALPNFANKYFSKDKSRCQSLAGFLIGATQIFGVAFKRHCQSSKDYSSCALKSINKLKKRSQSLAGLTKCAESGFDNIKQLHQSWTGVHSPVSKNTEILKWRPQTLRCINNFTINNSCETMMTKRFTLVNTRKSFKTLKNSCLSFRDLQNLASADFGILECRYPSFKGLPRSANTSDGAFEKESFVSKEWNATKRTFYFRVLTKLSNLLSLRKSYRHYTHIFLGIQPNLQLCSQSVKVHSVMKQYIESLYTKNHAQDKQTDNKIDTENAGFEKYVKKKSSPIDKNCMTKNKSYIDNFRTNANVHTIYEQFNDNILKTSRIYEKSLFYDRCLAMKDKVFNCKHLIEQNRYYVSKRRNCYWNTTERQCSMLLTTLKTFVTHLRFDSKVKITDTQLDYKQPIIKIESSNDLFFTTFTEIIDRRFHNTPRKNDISFYLSNAFNSNVDVVLTPKLVKYNC